MRFVSLKHLLIVTTALIVHSSIAADYTSINSGSWGSLVTWDLGSVPSSDPTSTGDNIVVAHNVTLNGSLTVKSGSQLTIESCDTLTVIGNLTFNNGSGVLVMSCAVLIVQGDVINNNNSDDVTINGTIQISGNYEGGNGSELDGTGNMDIDGSVTTGGSGSVFGSTEDCNADCDNSGFSPLPVELLSFNFAFVDNGIELSWATSSELNCDYFVIQKSENGQVFNNLVELKGGGSINELSNYQFIDQNPQLGVNYYRLLQYDYDGTVTNLGVLSCFNSNENEFQLYPNPIRSNEDIWLSTYVSKKTTATMSIYSTFGKVVSKCYIELVPGEVSTKINLKEDLPSGMYTIIIESDRKREAQKLTVY